jgi:S1-C subfamily serine protease
MTNRLRTTYLGFLVAMLTMGSGAHAWAQSAVLTAVPDDPNVALRAKLDTLTSTNDALAKDLEGLAALLKQDVCDPATRAKIEALLVGATSHSSAEPHSTPAAASAMQEQVATAPSTRAAQPLDRADLVKRLNAMTVLVITQNSFGSGIVVGPNLVLTNRHVVEEAQGKDVVVMNKSAQFVLRAKIAARTESSDFNAEDFALLSVEGALPPVAVQLAPAAQALENVIAAGYPSTVISNDQNFRKLLTGDAGDAPDIVLSRGIVNTVQNSGSAVPVIVHTAQIAPGSSGGPLVNSCGQIVGINTFLNQGSGGQAGFAISADVVGRFLNAHNVTLPVGPPCASDPL